MLVETRLAFQLWRTQTCPSTRLESERPCCMCGEFLLPHSYVHFVFPEAPIHVFQCIPEYRFLFQSFNTTFLFSNAIINARFEKHLGSISARNAFEATALSTMLQDYFRTVVQFEWHEYFVFENEQIIYHDTPIITFSL